MAFRGDDDRVLAESDHSLPLLAPDPRDERLLLRDQLGLAPVQ
jgi:hypothetical protein